MTARVPERVAVLGEPPRAGAAALLPWVVGLLAGLVLGWGSWTPGLWHDEVATLVAAERSWGSLLTMLTRVDAVHAAYYLLMHFWTDLAGQSAAALRLPSVLAIAGTAVVVTKLATRLGNPMIGAVAGLVFITIPRTSWLATEARPYALATLAATLMVHAVVRALAGGQRWWWAFGGIGWLAICLSLPTILLLPVLAAVVHLHRPGGHAAGPFWRAGLAAALGASPVIAAAASQREQVAFLRPLSPLEALQVPALAFFGGSSELNAVLWVAMLGICATLVIRAVRAANTIGSPAGPTPSMLLLIGGWLVFPTAVLIAVSLVKPLFLPRYVAFSTPAVAILIALALWSVGAKRWLAALCLVLVGALGVQSWVSYRLPDSRGDLLAVAAAVRDQRRPGDAVWFAPRGPHSDRTPRIVSYAYPNAFSGMRDLTLDQTYENSGGLWETERPLTPGADLAGIRRIAGVGFQFVSDERAIAPDLDTLQQAGFEVVGRQVMGSWFVLVLERQ